MATDTKCATRESPTPTELKVLNYIRAFCKTQGKSPTFQEMADGLNTTKVTIFGHVHGLKRKGWVHVDKHKARSIRLAAEACPMCGRTVSRRGRAAGDAIMLAVSELSDRSSPVDWSDALLLTARELRRILDDVLGA